MSKGKPCNCGSALKRRAKNKVLVICESCDTPLIGTNGRKYPLHLMPMYVQQSEVDHWINNGLNIIVQQPDSDN